MCEQLYRSVCYNIFYRSIIDTTLFIKSQSPSVLIVQIYVDDISYLRNQLLIFLWQSRVMKTKFENDDIIYRLKFSHVVGT